MKRRLRWINIVLMLGLLFGALGFMPKQVEAALPADLFISEYIEGSSFNKAIEIYNGTGSPVNLSSYILQLYTNGSATVSASVTLSGTLANEDVFVVSRTDANAAITAVTDLYSPTVINFNGDDAFALVNGSTIIDVIGVIGTDPGSAWIGGTVSTVNMTLVRKSTVCSGDPIGNDAFDPSIEWDGYAQDTFSFLGSHTSSCAPAETAPTVVSTSPSDGATMVPLDSNISITFSEAMTLAADWFEIDCSVSGIHTAVVTDTDPTFTLNPDSDFVLGDVCEVTIFAALASDEDLIDPPDTLAADYIFTFNVLRSPKINEFVFNPSGSDYNEYVEILGDPDTDYSSYKILQIEGDSGYGRINSVTDIAVNTDSNGFWWTGFLSGIFQNGTSTILLVKDSTATVGSDIDLDDDGVIDDTPPWSKLVDSVAVHDGGSSDKYYSTSILARNYDGIDFVPGGASRIPDGYDTESPTDWVRNDYDLAGIPGFTGTIVLGEAWNTPGMTNVAYTPPPESAPTVTSTNPLDNAVDVDKATDISITFSEPVTVTGSWYDITCTISGAHTAAVTDTDPTFILNPDVNFTPKDVCTVTVYATGVNDDDTDDATYDYMEANYTFDFTVGEACGDVFTPTYTIQGSGATSPLVGNTVAVEGVVVGDFQTGAYVSGTKNGFYIQDVTGDADPSTSDGLFIYTTIADVQVGDHVRVAGNVAEYTTGSGTLTQVTSVSQIWTCATGVVVAPTVMTLPVPTGFNYETLEGMLVTYPQDLVIAEYFNFDRYGEIVLTSERHMTPTALFEPGSPEYFQAVIDYNLDKITLDDGRTSQNPDPALHPNGSIFDMSNLFRGGSTVSDVTGILDFYMSLYRVQPTRGAIYTDTNPRTISPDLDPGELKIASFNVLNYFLTLDTGAAICGPLGNLGCRGANTPEELARQRAKILAALSIIDADVVGLMEIQNDLGESVADLVAGLNGLLGAGTYAYLDTGYIGTDAIKLAVIYKPASVTPDGTYQILDSTVDPRFIDDLNRPALAQVFVDTASGEKLVVAVNHLKSKSSACADDPDLGDGAGNCNLTREAAAQALVDWLANDSYFPGVENALIIGDLNSYDKEDPIDAIKLGADDTASTDDDYLDMIELFQGDEAYGYVFDGQVGYLDHALANLALADNILDVNIWHINADEADLIDYNMDFKAAAQDALYMPDAYRSSDHDPVVISLTLQYAPVAEDDDYVTTEDVALTVAAPGVLSNDTDVNLNDTLSAELVDDVTTGSLVFNADGSFTFTPALNFFGEVTFTYRVYDGFEYSEAATVTITVLPENDSPVAVDDAYETMEGMTLVVAAPGVMENDSDPDPGDTLWVLLMTPTQHGTVTLEADGSFVYTPAPGYVGTDTFIYALVSMARGDGYADTATVTIEVKPLFRYYFPLINK